MSATIHIAQPQHSARLVLKRGAYLARRNKDGRRVLLRPRRKAAILITEEGSEVVTGEGENIQV